MHTNCKILRVLK